MSDPDDREALLDEALDPTFPASDPISLQGTRFLQPAFQLQRSPMPFANFKIPQGTLNTEQKEEIIHKTTDLFAHYFGEGVRPYTMVLVDEVVDGGWGRADETFTLAKMKQAQEAGG
jgi:4-oxalocrotonate tautomerase